MITYLYISGVPKDKDKLKELLKLLGDEWETGSINSFINSTEITGIQYSIKSGGYGFVHNDEFKEYNKKVSYQEVIEKQHDLINLTHWGLESKKPVS